MWNWVYSLAHHRTHCLHLLHNSPSHWPHPPTHLQLVILPVDYGGGDVLVHEEEYGSQDSRDDGSYRRPRGEAITWGEGEGGREGGREGEGRRREGGREGGEEREG